MSHNLKTGVNIFKQMRSLGVVTPNEWEGLKIGNKVRNSWKIRFFLDFMKKYR
ncbi:hypothetical protein BSPWISOXPB_5645 [uncultured Gammaproteobacteria bacterium]|nr:hypothetical protein BSPWISOXPB_5645 [uncultured Gammaproteobacteria bacterium]